MKKSRRPRRRKNETSAQFDERFRNYEAKLSQNVEVKPKGNCMTMDYYVSCLLSIYAQYIHEARVYYNRDCILQKDNDPSHETQSTKKEITKAGVWRQKN